MLLNPVRAGLTERATGWRWSSARTLLGMDDDGVTAAEAIGHRWPDLAALLDSAEEDERTARLRRAETVGRPIGSPEFVERLAAASGRKLVPEKRGPKKRELSALSP